ncbi:neprilysin-21-like [Macrosteles quadrilineatus]|uniref:neprilysin-21-like n=1 Tax=Macrosteles quadrilineatus TaxID=74068 RepID=UPI0023E0DE9F|nr:neprilysin-21-like [Macrosteles quadrilineatus]
MIWNRASRKTLEDEDLIMGESPKYLSEIISLIKNSTKRQLANYIVWYNLMQFNYHPEPTRDSNYCFNTFMALNMPEMLTALAVKTRDESNYKIVNSLMENIEKEFVNQIKLCTWMNELTKEKALEKVDNLKLTIGFYQSFLDEDALDKFFKALEVGGNFYQTYREIWKFRIRLETDCFKQNLDSKLCRFMDYGELNLFRPNVLYDPLANEILVPDSFLGEPVISLSWSKYIHYGRLGFVLGNTLAHSVDVKGAHYDQLGRLNYWWDYVTSTNYQQEMKCVDKQVKKLLPLKESTIETLYDRESTIRSVADDAGIITSFKSYRNSQGWISDLMLPTVDYTKEQLFHSLGPFILRCPESAVISR